MDKELNYTLITICNSCGRGYPYLEPFFVCNKCGHIKYNLDAFNEHWELIHKKEIN